MSNAPGSYLYYKRCGLKLTLSRFSSTFNSLLFWSQPSLGCPTIVSLIPHPSLGWTMSGEVGAGGETPRKGLISGSYTRPGDSSSAGQDGRYCPPRIHTGLKPEGDKAEQSTNVGVSASDWLSPFTIRQAFGKYGMDLVDCKRFKVIFHFTLIFDFADSILFDLYEVWLIQCGMFVQINISMEPLLSLHNTFCMTNLNRLHLFARRLVVVCLCSRVFGVVPGQVRALLGLDPGLLRLVLCLEARAGARLTQIRVEVWWRPCEGRCLGLML